MRVERDMKIIVEDERGAHAVVVVVVVVVVLTT